MELKTSGPVDPFVRSDRPMRENGERFSAEHAPCRYGRLAPPVTNIHSPVPNRVSLPAYISAPWFLIHLSHVNNEDIMMKRPNMSICAGGAHQHQPIGKKVSSDELNMRYFSLADWQTPAAVLCLHICAP